MNLKKLPCFSHTNWKPDAAELQSFAKSMVIGFGIIGLIFAWKHQGFTNETFVLWGVGVALAVAALIPGLGRAAYLLVYIPTGILGFVISNIILTGLFFLIFTPIGLILRATGKDLLRLKDPQNASSWTLRTGTRTRESFYRQF